MTKGAQVEDIIDILGGCGRFQILLTVFVHTVKTVCAFSMCLIFLSIAVPKWRCAGDFDDVTNNFTDVQEINIGYTTAITGVTNNSTPYILLQSGNNVTDNEEHLYSPEQSCVTMNGTSCMKIVFDDSLHTIVSEWFMVCSLSWIPSMIGSVQMVGLFFGNVVSGQIADIIGRKVPLFVSVVLMIIGNFLGYFSTSWYMFAAARLLCGIAMGAFLTVQYTLPTEVTTGKWRTWVFGTPSWALQFCIFCLIGYHLPDWRKLHLLTAIGGLPFLLFWRVIPESFRWYLSHNRINNAQEVIKYIAKVNKTNVAEDSLNTLMNVENDNSKKADKKKYTFTHLFKTRRLVKVTLLLTLIWFNLGLSAYGMQFGIQALSGNFFFNLFLYNAIPIPGAVIPICLPNLVGRRPTVILAFSIVVIGGAVVGIVQHIDTDMKGSLINGFALFAGFGITAAWSSVQLMTQELYPTVIRNIAYGLLNTISRVGAVLGPQIAYLDIKFPGLMYFVCSGMSVCCILGTLALSETKGESLADVITRGASKEAQERQANEEHI